MTKVPIEDVVDEKQAEEAAVDETAAEPAGAEAADPAVEADGDEAAETADAQAGGDEAQAEGEPEADGEGTEEIDHDAMMQAAADALSKAQAEAADWHDKYLRLHAEWDTYRRRTNEQREAERARATEKLVTSLLPLIDDFERTIAYATDNGEEGLLSGVEAVHAKFIDILQKDGVVVIDPAGEAFDALECQAVATVDDAEAFDETVHDVYQKGYKMGDKVLRPAMVTVTTGGPKRPKPEEVDEEHDEE